MRGIFGKLGETFQLRRSGQAGVAAQERPDAVAGGADAAGPGAAPSQARWPVAPGDGRAPEARQALAACDMTTWTWDLATDRLCWGPAARAVLGRRGQLATGAEWAATVAAGSGPDRATAIAAAAGPDAGDGVPFHCRYVASIARGLCVVEERGRWHAGADGRPARAEGVLRLSPLDGRGADAGVFARRLEPARDVLLRTLAAVLHEQARGRRGVCVAACLLLPRRPDVAASALGVMEAAARAITRRLRRTDVVARLDCGQFALLLNGCDADQGRDAALAVLRQLERACPAFSAHIGLVAAKAGEADAPALLETAEAAAREAAAAGEPLATASPAAMRRPGAVAAVAPDVARLLNARAVGLRRHGLVEPGGAGLRLDAATPVAPCADGCSFMGRAVLAAAARRAGLAGLLDARMLELAVRELDRDRSAALLLTVSTGSVAGAEWRGALAAWLAAHPGVASRLTIAVDEEAFGDGGETGEGAGGERPEPRVIAQHLAMLKALGVGIAVSGYGAGWLGRDDLAAMAVDLVCLDGRLARSGLALAGPDRFIVRALTEGVRETGVPVLAPLC
ncbi:EAL domain-containing protein [Camelimonas abortus]|uniref:EAL domain-containing protein n=1 Tax=Camelimonas abortus TaxID=1017184 RepID=A0ABV7LBD1_9HYPH